MWLAAPVVPNCGLSSVAVGACGHDVLEGRLDVALVLQKNVIYVVLLLLSLFALQMFLLVFVFRVTLG